MKKYILKIIVISLFCIAVIPLQATAQNVVKNENVVENEEAYLKEFDLESFKDAGIKIKDSSVLYMHFVGVKWGYAMSGVNFAHTNDHKSIMSPRNFGVFYTYYHSMLGTMPYFGLQVGLASSQVGYVHVTKYTDGTTKEEEQIYSALELPLQSMFRAELKRFRLVLGIGGYLSYIYDTELPDGIPSTTKRGEFGVMGQGGIALKLHPIEISLEAIYKYGLTPFLDHKFYSEDQWIYTHPTQLQISAGLHFLVGRKYYKKK